MGNEQSLYANCKSDKQNKALQLLKDLDNKANGKNNANFISKKHKNTILMLACKNGNEVIANALFDSDMDLKINNVNDKGKTALIYALESKLHNISNLILEHECLPDKVADDEKTAILLACENKYEDTTLEIINQILDSRFYDKYGLDVLMLACQNRLEEVAIKLTNKNYNIVDKNNIYTLFSLVGAYELENVGINLLEYDVNLDDILLNACQNNSHKFIDTLLTKLLLSKDVINIRYRCLLKAFDNRDEDIALNLLELKYDLFVENDINNTLLTIACVNKLNKVGMRLLELNCKYDYVDNMKNTPLIYACANKMTQVSAKLIELGCDTEQVNILGQTALMYSCANGMEEICLSLLQTDCNPLQFDVLKNDAQIYAHTNNLESVEELLGDIIKKQTKQRTLSQSD